MEWLRNEEVVGNADAGFVHTGQESEIKGETFPFNGYGLVHGQIVSVALDSAPDPENQAQVHCRDGAAGDAPTVLRRSGGLVYVANIATDDPAVTLEGARMPLEPKMPGYLWQTLSCAMQMFPHGLPVLQVFAAGGSIRHSLS